MKYLKFATLLTLAIIYQNIDAQPTKIPPSHLDTVFKMVKWRNIGPFRGGRSVTASGVIGDPLTYYMGTTGGGLWKTTDAGQRWKNISDGYFKTGSVGAVTVSESHPNVVYCGMGEHAPRGVMTSYGDGVYKSTDAGSTWTHVGLKETQHISRIIVHPENPDIVFVAAQGALYDRNEERGIYKSIDGGKNWEKVLFVNSRTGCSELSIVKNNPLVMYAAMWEHQRLPWKVISGGEGSGMYKSVDGGETWFKIEKGLPTELGKMAVSVCQSKPNKVYALIESDSDQEKGGLFVSNDAGASWSRISKDHRLVQRAWYYIEVFADPVDENTVYVLSAPALRSIDGGKTWQRLYGTHGDYHDLWINPDNTQNLCIANDGGAAISFDYGKSWSTQANMPTAQFYRINVDNHYPYRIYGGQQDNSSVRIASEEFGSGGIGRSSWTASAGGESAFLAFDPDDPKVVLGGSYLGTVEALYPDANAGTRIMAAPIQYLGEDAKDQKYRFNWNAPIIWSKHQENTFYHASQHLLRTTDVGQSWEEASPDLSKDDEEKQGKPGGPYTNEAVGAENYGTISYVMESPQDAGVIWVSTDDGNVQLTKNYGANWTNITPKDLDECLVNAIEVSPHDPATAYIATTRYKFNDYSPAIYKTSDYGKTWTNISEGIPYGAFTRVVREDKDRKGLLYAGTELGIYISWNDGTSWQPMQLNLPICPITDLAVHQGDLIAATSGRSFWILDDLSLLQQYDPSKDAQLYKPADVVLSNGYSPLNSSSEKFTGMGDGRGINPATGLVVYYELPKLDDSIAVMMEIKDASGNLVRRLSTTKNAGYKRYDGGPPAEPTISKKNGLNRFVWDLRFPIMNGVPGVYIEGSYRGHKAIPGTYNLALMYGDEKHETSFEILPNPLYPSSESDYLMYHSTMASMENELINMHNMVNSLDEIKKQINEVSKKLKGNLAQEAKEITAAITAWDEDMVQRKSKAYDDVENFPNKFTANYLFLINQTESEIPRVNEPSLMRLKELTEEWNGLRSTAESIMQDKVKPFNKKLWEAGYGAIWLASDVERT